VRHPARSRFDTGVSLRTALRTSATGRRGTKVLASLVEQTIASMGPPPIRAAVMTGGRGLAVRAATTVARRIFGSRTSQVGAIARQTAARPAVRFAAAGGAVVAAERAIEATTGRSPARMVFDLTQGRGRDVFDTAPTRTRPSTPRRQPMGRDLAIPQHQVVRTWQTFPGGPVFARFADGHIEVQKKDGTIKHYRPYRPVVIPRKWDARSMRRVATALKRQRKVATKILQLTGGVPKRTVRQVIPARATVHRGVDVD